MPEAKQNEEPERKAHRKFTSDHQVVEQKVEAAPAEPAATEETSSDE